MCNESDIGNPTKKRKVSSKACDACRIRKVRCDTQDPPCRNCQIYGTECKYDAPRRRRGPKPINDPQAEIPFTVVGEDLPASSSLSDRNLSATSETPSLAIIRPDSGLGQETQPFQSVSVGSTHSASPRSNLGSVPSSSHRYIPSHASHSSAAHSPLSIQQEVASTLTKYGSPSILAEQCLRKFVLYKFPFCPAVHVESVAKVIPILSQQTHTPSMLSLPEEGAEVENGIDASQFSLEDMRSYALLTAMCGVMCTIPEGDPVSSCDDSKLAKIFLSASRSMLSCYADFDMEHPDSSSLIIRFLQSNTLHHFGNTKAAMHLLRSAWSLALTLRLYDEESLIGIDALESQRLRNIFWAMYQGDKSASLLNGAPSMMLGVCLEDPITLAIENPLPGTLLHGNTAIVGDGFEQQAMVGFYLSTHLWKIGSDILLDLKLIAHMRTRANADELCLPEARDMAIMHSYLSLCALLDDMPPWLQNPDSHIVLAETPLTPSGNDSQTALRRRFFWAQRANLIITFHCLRLAIIRHAEKYRLCHLFGLTNDEPLLAMRKFKITSDLLVAAKSVPFEGLQANGEPCVEKLRQAGVELLGIAHQTTDQALAARAHGLFLQLLDVITALNSKVSDELAGEIALD